uniref:Calmodulin-binding protein n=1 Tax=Chenopodium quinoa TaxID=63459 RepID=A0A803M2L4_CHEQI
MQSPSSIDFDFNSGRASPCGSSPSTPKGFGDYYFSAPTSPTRPIGIYREVEQFSEVSNYTRGDTSTSDLSFDFPFATKTESKSLVKPLPFEGHKLESVDSPLLSSHSTKLQQKKTLSDSRNGRRAIRSLSPPRESKYPWEQEQNKEEIPSTSKPTSSPLTLSTSSKGSKKWRLKDLLLFRSASEGRASEKDLLKKYSHLHRKHEVANSSGLPSTQGSSSIIPARREPISAHELHYTVNKAISQDMRKKSFLPYKQGILGRLAVNPTVHALAHGYGL